MYASIPARHAPAADLPALAAELSGSMIRPGDPTYDAARIVHNLAFASRPAAIVRPADAADVARTVRFAARSGMTLAVRSGGHSVAGHSTGEGVLVLDLTSLRGLHIDPSSRVVVAGAGLTAGEVTAAAGEHGLAVPFGDAPSVGIGGLTLGGGIGFLVRRFGLTIDNLLAVEIVTADGEVRTASATEHQDLFWAVRGGGGNMGVVTRFTFRAQPVPMTLGGALLIEPTRDALRALVPVAASAPEELTTISMLMPAPPHPAVPGEWQGRQALMVMVVWAGEDLDAGQRAVDELRKIGPVIADLVAPMPYAAIYELTREAGEPHPSVVRSAFMDVMDDAAVDAIVARQADAPPMAMTQIRVLGGAMSRVPSDATAFAHRDAPIMFTVMAGIHDPSQAASIEAWADGFLADLAPQSRGVYVNFLADEGAARVHEAYPGETYARLAAAKRRWDPANLFRRNQNITPA